MNIFSFMAVTLIACDFITSLTLNIFEAKYISTSKYIIDG